MIDSDLDKNRHANRDYSPGQDLYAASVTDMQGWIRLLQQDIQRLEAEIKKKQGERAAADSIFRKPE